MRSICGSNSEEIKSSLSTTAYDLVLVMSLSCCWWDFGIRINSWCIPRKFELLLATITAFLIFPTWLVSGYIPHIENKIHIYIYQSNKLKDLYCTWIGAVVVHFLRFSSSTCFIPYKEGSLAATKIVFSSSSTFPITKIHFQNSKQISSFLICLVFQIHTCHSMLSQLERSSFLSQDCSPLTRSHSWKLPWRLSITK